MYENAEGDFAYTVRREERGGQVSYRWEVRHVPSGRLVDAGNAPRSHDAGKTAALETIFEAQRTLRGEPDTIAPPTQPQPASAEDDAAQAVLAKDLAKEEQYVLRCLGGAVIMQWNTLPSDIQRELFQAASCMGEPRLTAQLKERIARFLHKHKDAGNPAG